MPRQSRPSRGGSSPTPQQLDLDQFSSLEDALRRVEPCERYLDVGRPVLGVGSGLPLTMPTLFWFSMLARVQGLHSAIAREIRVGNPHAVFPLIRALVEAVVLVIYVTDHPKYVEVLTTRASELPKSGPRRKSIQWLINYASKDAAGIKDVYADLSEMTHFGSLAMWTSHRPEQQDGAFSWSSGPRWRDDEQALIACAQTLELADEMVTLLEAFRDRYVLPKSPRVAGQSTD